MSFEALSSIRGIEPPSPSALLLLFILAEYAGPDGCCFPAQSTLSDRSGLSVRAVRDNMGLLEEAGLIAQERRNRKDGTRSSNRIRLLYYRPEQAAESAASFEAEPEPTRSAGRLNGAAHQAAKSAASLGEEALPGACDNRQPAPSLPAAAAGLTTFEPITEAITSPRERDVVEAFERFWAVYPRKAERPGALKLFERVLRKRTATADELIAAAQRYAIAVHGRDGAMIKNPTTWLQRECWQDGAASPATSGNGSAAVPVSTRTGFAGPAELRAATVAARGEAWAISWFDPCGWDEERRAVVPRTRLAQDRIRQELGRDLKSWGVALGDPERAHAPG